MQNASHQEAVAITYGGALAIHFMKNGNIKKGDKVLIYGASGAIGTTAIQIAKHHGAIVTAVCSEKNFKLVDSLGSDKTLDYTRKDAAKHLEDYDFILDAVGKNKTSDLKEACKKSLRLNGNYVSVDDSFLKMQPDYLPKLKASFEAGHLRAIIDRTYFLKDIVIAHEYVEKGHKKGNVLIQL